MDPETSQQEDTRKFPQGGYHDRIHALIVNTDKEWRQILDSSQISFRVRTKTTSYSKNSVELSGCKVLDLRYTVGKVVYSRHGR